MLIALIFILALLSISTVLSLVYPIGGTWERMSDLNQSIWDRERVVLKEFGPFVFGTQTVSGGVQKFFGFAFGPFLWLHRRDYGIQALINSGFPEPIAKLVQGRVLLRMKLSLSSDRLFLNGHATPFKVEFYEDASGIKGVHTLDPTPRKYRRAELTPISEPSMAPIGKQVELGSI